MGHALTITRGKLDGITAIANENGVIAAAAIVVWWAVSKTVYALRRGRGAGPARGGPQEPRPRRRIPLY